MSDGGSTPKQYELPKGATELQDLIEFRDMNFAVGNIFKACFRLGSKNDAMYEMNKVLWFAQREHDRLLGELDEILDYDKSDFSINRLLETASAKALEAVKTGEKSAVIHAIDLLGEAYIKMLELENE